MNACFRSCSAGLLALSPALHARAQDPAQHVAELFQAGRYGAALASTPGIDDLTLRAEWRFQILHSGGALPEALAAALEGLASAPEHLGLLQNATVCALTLGLGERSRELSGRWRAAIEGAGTDSGAREPARARHAALEPQVVALVRRDAERVRATRRARWMAVSILAGALGVLLLLAVLGAGRAPTQPAARDA